MPITDCTGVLLAGGQSRRFGGNKALAPVNGCRLIEHPARLLAELFEHRLLVTNTPELYAFLDWPMIPDLTPGSGPLAGIQAALSRAATPCVFVAACDMPNLDRALIKHLYSLAAGYDAVIPVSAKGWEPLHGVYSRTALPVISTALAAGTRKLQTVLATLKIREVGEKEMLAVSATALQSFRNINRVSDLPPERNGREGKVKS
jgi:molybdopterin-guanine dinucleotide biosynthesis protein A